MNEHSKRLEKTLKKITKIIHEILEVSDPLIRQVHEDGVSSIILKKIAKLSKDDIYVKTKSLEVNECKTGIDFDLWIGENDKRYIRLIVQAKSFGNNTKPNESYNFSKTQCEKIIAHSKRNHQSFPLYFLYQHIQDSNIKGNYFPFLYDFKYYHSSITFTSAYAIQKHIEKGELAFSDLHRNQFDTKWKNEIYELFQREDYKISLPLYLLSDISPSKIDSFQKLIATKNNSVGFFFFFFFGEEFPFEIHNISGKEIMNSYGENKTESEIQFKNLIIINDTNKMMRDRDEKLSDWLI